MKNTFLIGCITLAIATSLHAQVFMASTPVTSDSDVLTAGLPVMAFAAVDFGNGNTQTVNGVTFVGGTAGPGSVTITGDGVTAFGSGFGGTGAGDSAGLSPTLSTVLSTNGFGGTLSLSLSGLTVGQTYALQVFASDGTSGSETFKDTTTNKSVILDFGPSTSTSNASYVIETFTPTTTSENFATTLISGGDEGFAIINAFDLRAIPEPSSYALMLAGLVLIAGLAFRRGIPAANG